MDNNLTFDANLFYKETNAIAAKLKAKKGMPRALHPKVEQVTDRSAEVIEFMRSFLSENDRMPKMSDLSFHFGWASNNSAQAHVDKLIRLKVLEKSGACSYRFFRENNTAPDAVFLRPSTGTTMHLHPEGTTARFFQEHPVAAIDALEALKFSMEFFPNPVHPARLQGMAIIELVEMQHVPRRPTEKHLPFSFVTTTGEGGATVECRFDFDAEGDVEVLQVFVDGEGKDIKDALTEGQVIELEAECHKAAEAAQADSRYDAGQAAYEERMAA